MSEPIALVAGRQRDRAGGDERAARGAEHERDAGERGEHEPGQQPVAERLGRVGLAVQQHPHAERAEREREDQDLEQRAAGDRVGEHRSVLVVLDGDGGRAVGEDDELGAVGGLQHVRG